MAGIRIAVSFRKLVACLVVTAATLVVLTTPARALTYGPATHYPLEKQGPNHVVAADFNLDGHPDLAVANEQGPTGVSILLGDGTGAFSAPTAFATGQSPFWLAVGDFDEDETPDLAVATVVGGSIEIYLGNGDGTFTAGPHLYTGSSFTVVAADFNS